MRRREPQDERCQDGRQTVTEEFKVDQYDSVYDSDGMFYCKWFMLTDDEKETVKKNPMSFY